MSTSPPATERTGLQPVTGRGRASRSAAQIAHVDTQEDLERIVASARKTATPILARGLGRSYGDVAQCTGGILLDCTALDRVIDADFDNGLLRVEAGIPLDAVLGHVIPNGTLWFLVCNLGGTLAYAASLSSIVTSPSPVTSPLAAR